jgi:hypothetical protein
MYRFAFQTRGRASWGHAKGIDPKINGHFFIILTRFSSVFTPFATKPHYSFIAIYFCTFYFSFGYDSKAIFKAG